jgi:hypothetical protein
MILSEICKIRTMIGTEQGTILPNDKPHQPPVETKPPTASSLKFTGHELSHITVLFSFHQRTNNLLLFLL